MTDYCVHAFGGIEALSYEAVPRPTPSAGQVLVRIAAAGVGPWALPLSQARLAHEMLAGRPHKSGKIVLVPGS